MNAYKMEIINITNLCELLKNNLPKTIFKIIGEVNQPKISNGHLYFTFKDNNSSIKAIIWKTRYDKMDPINDGDKITVNGKLDYYMYSGTINFIVESIIENNGIGELQQKYEKLKNQYIKNGYFKKENKLELPKIIKKILILTSLTGAAIQDFIFNLENNNSQIKYTIIDVPVQGTECPITISSKLNDLNKQNLDYDLIIITRGGGSYQDLFGFSDPLIIESVYNFKNIPILSAIGHQIDNPLLDFVADYSCPTPSLASQFIVDINKQLLNNYKNIIISSIFEKQKQLSLIKNKLDEIKKELFNNIRNILYKFNNNILNELSNKKNKLENMKNLLNSPNIMLLDLKFNKINSNEEINKDNIYIMRWNNQDYKIKIL